MATYQCGNGSIIVHLGSKRYDCDITVIMQNVDDTARNAVSNALNEHFNFTAEHRGQDGASHFHYVVRTSEPYPKRYKTPEELLALAQKTVAEIEGINVLSEQDVLDFTPGVRRKTFEDLVRSKSSPKLRLIQ